MKFNKKKRKPISDEDYTLTEEVLDDLVEPVKLGLVALSEISLSDFVNYGVLLKKTCYYKLKQREIKEQEQALYEEKIKLEKEQHQLEILDNKLNKYEDLGNQRLNLMLYLDDQNVDRKVIDNCIETITYQMDKLISEIEEGIIKIKNRDNSVSGESCKIYKK